ncbi:MAG: hypothetical protein PHP00_09805 [Thiotrichaceae bacterium]|jgi:hypothetical protein|nr:hypothetical protein [Thiotrichaceae bacterium]
MRLFYLALLLLSTPAWAVDLMNETDETYDVKITSKASKVAQRFSIKPHAFLKDVCDKACTINVMGIDEITAQTKERVVINEGALSKR